MKSRFLAYLTVTLIACGTAYRAAAQTNAPLLCGNEVAKRQLFDALKSCKGETFPEQGAMCESKNPECCDAVEALTNCGSADKRSTRDVLPGNKKDVTTLRILLTTLFAMNPAAKSDLGLMLLDTALAEIESFDASQTKYVGKVVMGANTDSSELSSRYVVNGGIEFKKGTFPAVFSSGFNMSVTATDDNRFDEDVSTFFVRHEQFLGASDERESLRIPGLLTGGYVFGQRFTDEFMDIDERYEVGVGLRFEFNSNGLPTPTSFGRKLSARSALEQMLPSEAALRRARVPGANDVLKPLRNAAFELAQNYMATFEAKRCTPKGDLASCLGKVSGLVDSAIAYRSRERVARGLARQTSRLRFGLNLGVQGELEQTSIDLLLSDADEDAKPDTFGFPTRTTFRAVIEPSILVRLSNSLSFSGSFSHRRAVGGDKHEERDTHETLSASLNLNLKPAVISLSYTKYWDSVPQALGCEQALASDTFSAAVQDPDDAEDCLPLNEVFQRSVSPSRHELVRLNINVPF